MTDRTDHELKPLLADLERVCEAASPETNKVIYPRPAAGTAQQPTYSEPTPPYLLQREEEEQAKANRSPNPYVAGVHRRLARLYRRKLENLDAR